MCGSPARFPLLPQFRIRMQPSNTHDLPNYFQIAFSNSLTSEAISTSIQFKKCFISLAPKGFRDAPAEKKHQQLHLHRVSKLFTKRIAIYCWLRSYEWLIKWIIFLFVFFKWLDSTSPCPQPWGLEKPRLGNFSTRLPWATERYKLEKTHDLPPEAFTYPHPPLLRQRRS
jgi:hypothetical protein